MDIQCRLLIHYALQRGCTDIHMKVKGQFLDLSMRKDGDLVPLKQDIFSPRLFEYFKYLSRMDLCDPMHAQSGQFSLDLSGQHVDLRFSLIAEPSFSCGVLRILHTWKHFALPDLTPNIQAQRLLESMIHLENGLVLSCGPTGSGKTTTIHALLRLLNQEHPCKIVTLEDPVEITEEDMIQLNVNEARGLSYEKGIEELMRHDPSVIFLGECRSAQSAKMAVRAALTGTLVFSTIHAGSGKECLHRLIDLGVSLDDLKVVLKGVFAQRLVSHGNRKECIYEIWNGQNLEDLLEYRDCARPSLSFKDCQNHKAGTR